MVHRYAVLLLRRRRPPLHWQRTSSLLLLDITSSSPYPSINHPSLLTLSGTSPMDLLPLKAPLSRLKGASPASVATSLLVRVPSQASMPPEMQPSGRPHGSAIKGQPAQQPNSPTAQQPNSPTAQQPNSPTAQQAEVRYRKDLPIPN